MKTHCFFTTATITYFTVLGIHSAHALGLQPAPLPAALPFAIAHAGHEHPHPDGMPMTEPGTQEEGSHTHGAMEVPANQLLPTVKLIAHPDARKGWNLEVQITNFKFAPEHVNQTSIPTEGHAHLYIDGEKITRLYGNWYYLGSLPPGEHEITVTLNANGHESLMHNGEPIQASVVVAATPPAR